MFTVKFCGNPFDERGSQLKSKLGVKPLLSGSNVALTIKWLINIINR